jgi:hypothetical protein
MCPNFNNGRMSRSNRPFKDTQVFGWEVEPKDERPSEFVQSTGYSALSGYYSMPEVRSRPPDRRSGISLVVVAGIVFVALGTAALLGFLHMIRG